MRYGRPIRLSAASYANAETAFHLVVRTHPQVGSLSLPIRDAIWQSALSQSDRPEVALHAAVLMPDHIHFVASPGTIDIVRWIGHWKSISTRSAWAAGQRGTIWQRRFYDRALRSVEEFGVALDYVLRNPIAASLVQDGEEWPHSWIRDIES